MGMWPVVFEISDMWLVIRDAGKNCCSRLQTSFIFLELTYVG